jgi:NADH dehydrogenase [ubiquinone] 1 alpha subcomplex assembly factor 1
MTLALCPGARSKPFNRVNGGHQQYALSYARPMQELWVVNDGVMGGRSRSKLLPTATGLLFEGEVALSNGGGFASFRAPLRLPSDVVALQVAVSGDDRRYRFVLRADEDSGTAQYQAPFVAPHAWTMLRFVSGDFAARFRGRLLVAPPLVLADVRAFGLLIGEGQSGPFRVELKLPRAG